MSRFTDKGGISIRQVRCISAIRKGRDRKPCEVGVCITDKGEIILRTEDVSGTAPIVVVLETEGVELLQMGLLEATEKVRQII